MSVAHSPLRRRRAHGSLASYCSGRITSGIPSPSTGKNIAMALIKNGYHKKDTKVQVEVRQKLRPAQIAKLPFVPNKFYRGKQ